MPNTAFTSSRAYAQNKPTTSDCGYIRSLLLPTLFLSVWKAGQG
jgi:hypothetical protein